MKKTEGVELELPKGMIEEIKVSVEEMNYSIISVEFHRLQNSDFFATGASPV
jgi:hypothetical protein